MSKKRKKKKYQSKNVNNNARKTSQAPAVKEETELVKPLPIGDKQGLSEEDIIIEETASFEEIAAIEETAPAAEAALTDISDDTASKDEDTSADISKAAGSDIKSLWIYLAFFAGSFLYWEILMRLLISRGFGKENIGVFFFIPALALLFTAFCGVHKNHLLINKIAVTVLTFIPALYYSIQLIYYRIFGSLISVSMLGMGTEAVGNFGWALKDVVIGSLGLLFLTLFPVILSAVFSFSGLLKTKNRKPIWGRGYKRWLHLVILASVAFLWYGGTLGLKLLGTGRGTAYYVITDAMADTDTTAERIGTLPTTVVETGSYYFGIGKGDEMALAAVNEEALNLEAEEEKPETVVKEYKGVTVEPHINENIDFEALSQMTEDKAIKDLCNYFGSKRPTKTNEYTGIFEGYNLIYICGEAFSNYGIDPDITPTLYKMATNGIVLNNFYNSFPNTTTNGEYAFSTSYWPDVSRIADSGTVAGSFAQSADKFMPFGLGDFFTAEGKTSYAYHNYYGNYYWRDHSWPNLGYRNIKFMGDGMEFTSSWPASDLELFEQSVDDYIDDDCFQAYYMTFSGHGPYGASNAMYKKNIDAVKALAGDKYKDNAILGYFCGEYELELGMEYLLGRLEEAGKLDNTVIVLVGDHFPYFLPDSAKLELNGGEPMDSTFEQYHSTCIIYNAGLKEPIVSDEYCCNVDILPTILNLFNIEYDSRLLMGIDIFSGNVHRARLYNGSFITDYVKYDKRSGKAIWSDKMNGFSEENKEKYLEAMLDYTESEYSASLQMLKSNFWFYVWQNSGFMTDEEIQAEIDREKSYNSDYNAQANYEAEKAALEAERKAQEEAQTEGGENTEGTNPKPAPAPEAAPTPAAEEPAQETPQTNPGGE
ncbi:MAG: sulfatase-like hydrolase/transferase [Lachnospiraceae bacterium]|nr:sulfatase-like hydrolase/transferase [Lachnospiraceae bacterium]